MLLGRYDGKISERFQIAVPSKFRQDLGDKLIITKGLENYLIVVSEEKWKTLLEGTENEPFTKKPARDMQRFLLGNAHYVELDDKGRCVLPEHLREYAGLTDEVVYAGIERFVEVWDKQVWEETQNILSKNIESIAEKLSNETAREGKNEPVS